MQTVSLFYLLSNIFAYSNFIGTKNGVIMDGEIWIIETYYSLLNHIWQSRFVLLVMLNISQIPNKLYLAERFVQTSSVMLLCSNKGHDVSYQGRGTFECGVEIFKGRGVGWHHGGLSMSINYNLFLMSCILCAAHMASLAN